MAAFVIEPHFRLQEWVAEKKGYTRDGIDETVRWIFERGIFEGSAYVYNYDQAIVRD